MFENIESIYRGVPLLIIPFVADQFRNADRAQEAGYAKQLDFKHFTSDCLVSAIYEITTDESYLNQAKHYSAVFKDRDSIIKPMDNAVWWIEHVAKFNGAKHLKSHAVNMSWFTYLLLDVFCVIIFGFLSTVIISFYIIKIVKTKFDEKRKQKRIKLY